MKKLKFLFVLLLAILIIPFVAYAEDEENVDEGQEVTAAEEVNTDGESQDEGNHEEGRNKVKLYFFRGEGCSHCAEAKEWFDSIQEEYGKYFEIVDYETWYDEDNADLMKKVAESRDETADGVPYILVGNKSWNGFADSYKEQITAEILSEYDKDDSERHDALKLVKSSKKAKKEDTTGKDVLSLTIILLVTGGICFGVYKARNNTD